MKLLITGANSPLGIAFARRAHAANHYVIGGVRESKMAWSSNYLHEKIFLDFRNIESLANIPDDTECIVHIAAVNEGTPQELLEVNGLGTYSLIESAIRCGIKKIIHISSMSVYGTVTEPIVDSRTIIRHSTPYGLSKWAGECYLNDRSDKLNSVCIRSPAIVGQSAHRHFLAKVVEQMTEKKTLLS